MQNKLLSIFNAITPDNIKDIKVISDSMNIFIELLSELSPISTDIHIALSEKTTESISEELPKIYLYDYYSMIQNLKTNKNIIKKFRDWNAILNPGLYPVGLPYIGESLFINFFIIGQDGSILSLDNDDDEGNININPLSKKLAMLQHNILQNNAENYYINRLFKQSKGLVKSINFIYDIINEYLVNPDERLKLSLQETSNPFEFVISGSVDKDIYEQSVAYLSHPAGFIFTYDYISSLNIEEDYTFADKYTINTLSVSKNSTVVNFTDEVIFIKETNNSIKIVFKNNYYLLKDESTIKHYNSSDELITAWDVTDGWILNLDYTFTLEEVFTDEFNIQLI